MDPHQPRRRQTRPFQRVAHRYIFRRGRHHTTYCRRELNGGRNQFAVPIRHAEENVDFPAVDERVAGRCGAHVKRNHSLYRFPWRDALSRLSAAFRNTDLDPRWHKHRGLYSKQRRTCCAPAHPVPNEHCREPYHRRERARGSNQLDPPNRHTTQRAEQSLAVLMKPGRCSSTPPGRTQNQNCRSRRMARRRCYRSPEARSLPPSSTRSPGSSSSEAEAMLPLSRKQQSRLGDPKKPTRKPDEKSSRRPRWNRLVESRTINATERA